MFILFFKCLFLLLFLFVCCKMTLFHNYVFLIADYVSRCSLSGPQRVGEIRMLINYVKHNV